MSSGSVPCLALSLGEDAFIEESSSTFLLDLDLAIDAKEIYTGLFGPGSYDSPDHRQNWKCLLDYADGLKASLAGFCKNLQKDLDTRLDFAQKGLQENRGTRSLSLVSAGFSITAMATSFGSLIYLKMSRDEFLSFVQNLANRMDESDKFTSVLASNIKILKGNEGLIGARVNLLTTNFDIFRDWQTCQGLRLILKFEQERTTHRLNKLFNDLLSDRLTPSLLPMDRLVELLQESPDLVEGSLYQDDVVRIYSEARISLLSVDQSKHTVRILVAFPRSPRSPSFRQVHVLSPHSAIVKGKKIFARHLRGMRDIFLPIENVTSNRADGFPLTTAKDVKMLKHLTGCRMMGSRKICDGSGPLDAASSACLESLFLDLPGKACDYGEGPLDRIPLVSVERGFDGLVLSTSDSSRIVGVDGGRTEQLFHGAAVVSGHRQCIYIPGHYEKVIVESNGQRETIIQRYSITQTLYKGSPEVVHYLENSPKWPDLETLNLTEIEEMKRNQQNSSWYGQMGSWVNLGLFTAFILGLVVFGVTRYFWDKRSKRKRENAERDELADLVTWRRSMPARDEVAFSLPPLARVSRANMRQNPVNAS